LGDSSDWKIPIGEVLKIVLWSFLAIASTAFGCFLLYYGYHKAWLVNWEMLAVTIFCFVFWPALVFCAWSGFREDLSKMIRKHTQNG
jgi:hypothetical protein